MDDQDTTQRGGSMGAVAMTLRTCDLEAMKDAVSGVPLEVERLAPGSLEISLSHVGLHRMSVTVGAFGFPLTSKGSTGDGAVTVAFQQGVGQGHWNGVALDPDSVWIYGPGSEHQGVAGEPPPFATLTMPTDVYTRHCTAAGDLRDVQPGSVAVHRSPAVRGLSALVGDLVSTVPTGPVQERVAGVVEDELGNQVVSVLSATEPTDRLQVSRTTAVSLVDDCVVAAEFLGPQPSSVQLSEHLGVSDRWIRTGFREVVGVSPSRYFRSRALHRAHAELRRGHPATTSVTEVAMKWGFWHLGRFSGLYRSYFGELPSETLAGDADR